MKREHKIQSFLINGKTENVNRGKCVKLTVIRNIGFNTDGQSGIYACGDGSIEPSLKQEKECLVN